MRYKLVAFDLDGTLVQEPSSWVKLHNHFGTLDKADENLRAYERGKIDYGEFMRRDVALWQPPPHIRTIELILHDYTLSLNAECVIRSLMEGGFEVAIVSSGIDILANDVAETLGIRHVLANGLSADEEGILTGEVIFRVDPFRKDESLECLSDCLGITMGECVAVGDSKFDRRFLERAGVGIAYGPDEGLLDVADLVVNDLAEVLEFLQYQT
ncbi:MAG: HAD-IB family phosphatase [Candidatus Bathyarchaeia archaeon]